MLKIKFAPNPQFKKRYKIKNGDYLTKMGLKITNRIGKYSEVVWLITYSSMFDFLVQCRLADLIQDIVISQFDSNAFIKAYIVGVSV